MVTHADHDAFAKQAAESVYPVSDDDEDEEDDKGWGAKEWLSLALASGGLAAGLGAAYLYRKEIGDFLGNRIGGDTRGPLDKLTGDHLGGMSPGTLVGVGTALASALPVARRRGPLGDAHKQQTMGGYVNEIAKGGPHADILARHLGQTNIPGMTPEETSKALQTHINDAASNPRNVISELSSSKDIFKQPGAPKPILNPTRWSWLHSPLRAGREQSNFVRNAKLVQEHADAARTVLYNTGHNFGALIPEQAKALDLSKRFQLQVAKGYGLDPVHNLPLEHSTSGNIHAFAQNLRNGQRVLPSKGLGQIAINGGIGWTIGTLGDGAVNMATGH